MPVFEYIAVDCGSAAVSGTVVADTPGQARQELRDRGLSVSHMHSVAAKSAARRRSGSKVQAEVVSFVRELATLLKVGIPLLGALQTLARQHGQPFKAVIQLLSDRIAAGVSLADAMKEQEAYFDAFCVSIVAVGENTGSLETALKRLAEFKEKSGRLRSKVTTALIYPAIVCVIGLAVSLFLMTYVVPNILATLKQSGKELPAITRLVQSASDFLRAWWWLVLGCAAGLAAGAKALLRLPKCRRTADKAYLRLPVVGQLIRKENTSRIAVVLSALLRSGLPFVQAVGITRDTVRNRIYAQALERYEAAVTAGRDVSGPLEETGVFSPMVIQMLAVGQETGNLEEMLEQLADTYDQEVATATTRLTAMLEPLLIVLLAILVATIALATILPILEISNVL